MLRLIFVQKRKVHDPQSSVSSISNLLQFDLQIYPQLLDLLSLLRPLHAVRLHVNVFSIYNDLLTKQHWPKFLFENMKVEILQTILFDRVSLNPS